MYISSDKEFYYYIPWH